jgi:ribosome-binding factor A
MLIPRELSDPRLTGLVVTRVEVPPDLSAAYVFVRLLVADDQPRARVTAVKSLQRAAGRLRRGVGTELNLKRIPELRFAYDEAPDKRARVDQILGEIAAEREQRPEVEDPGAVEAD